MPKLDLVTYADCEFLGVDGVHQVETGELRCGISLAGEAQGEPAQFDFTLSVADAEKLVVKLALVCHEIRRMLEEDDG